MFKASFKNVEELKKFIQDYDFDEVKFCVDPDYIEAIIGLSDYGKLVYDYDKMVEHLARIYEQEPNCDDPQTDAVEWVGYNCDIPYWEIVYREDIYDSFPELSGMFDNYKRTVIGQNTHGVLLLDSEYVTDKEIEDIESILQDNEIEYKII